MDFADRISSSFEIIPIDPSLEYQSPFTYQSVLNDYNAGNNDVQIHGAITTDTIINYDLIDINSSVEKSKIFIKNDNTNKSNELSHLGEASISKQFDNVNSEKQISNHKDPIKSKNVPLKFPIRKRTNQENILKDNCLDKDGKITNLKIAENRIEKEVEEQIEPVTIADKKNIDNDVHNKKVSNLNKKEETVHKKLNKCIPERKKLNLEEYKRRRQNCDNNCVTFKTSSNNNSEKKPILNMTDTVQSNFDNKPFKTSNEKQIAEVEIMIDKIKNDLEKKSFDPILAATKKALQLKKGRLRDTNIHIPNENIKIYPMGTISEMKSAADNIELSCPQDTNFEEIVIVSIGINTTISLSPGFNMSDTSKILSSTSLLLNISDTINKTNSYNYKKSGSVIESQMRNGNDKKIPEKDKTLFDSRENDHEHGEDKIIMHLRKDRIKPQKCSKSVQTDTLTHFVPLSKLGNAYNDDAATKYKNSDSKYSDFHISDSNSFKVNNKTINNKPNWFKRSSSRCSDSASSSASSVSRRTRTKKRYNSSSSSSSSNSNSSYDKTRGNSTKREVTGRTKRQKSPGRPLY